MLPFGGLWYTTIPDAIDYAKHRSRAHDAVISVYDAAGKLIEEIGTRAISEKPDQCTTASLFLREVLGATSRVSGETL